MEIDQRFAHWHSLLRFLMARKARQHHNHSFLCLLGFPPVSHGDTKGIHWRRRSAFHIYFPYEAVSAMALSATQRGMASMLLATLAMVIMSAVFRHLSTALHPFEISFFRSVFGLLFFAPLFVRQGLAPLKTRRLGAHISRGSVNAVSMLCFFLALKYTSLAKVAALFFATPLFAAVLAVLVLHEAIKARRVSALAIGFVGMLIIIQPGSDTLDFGAILVLISAILSGIAVILVKRLATTESSVTITIYMGLVTTPVSLIAAIPVWAAPDLEQLAWMLAAGCFGSIGQLAMVRAYALADASAILPLEFFKLIWSAIIGYAFFAELVDLSTWIGGTIILASTVYITHHERHEKPQATALSQPNS
jgi:drug/metabolite transporter (DMT)-like permease